MITITDVAIKAGVSRATVSYVLNKSNTAVRISDDTRQRVLEAANHLGYRRNELARAVITGKNRMLGFWVMQSNREPVIRVLAGAMKEADENDYFIKMLGFDNSAVESKIVERCIEWRLSGIIAIHAPEAMELALRPQFLAANIPIVTVDSQQPPEGTIHIASASAAGIESVIEHLVELGHRDIAFIAGEPDPSDTISSCRIQAYKKAMKSSGLESHVQIVHGHWEVDTTEHAVRQLLNGHRRDSRRPTAIACASDHMAMVTIRTAAQMGIRVPEALSVTGFDDLTIAALYNPPLTTVVQPFEDMGRLAVLRLLECVKEVRPAASPSCEELLPTKLIVRQSTASPGKQGVL